MKRMNYYGPNDLFMTDELDDLQNSFVFPQDKRCVIPYPNAGPIIVL